MRRHPFDVGAVRYPACGAGRRTVRAVPLPRRHLALVHRPGALRELRAAALARLDVVDSLAVLSSRVELLTHLDTCSPAQRPGVVIVAHDPPWIDGVDLVRMMRRIADGHPYDTVLVDADDATTAIDALRAGATGVVQCPADAAELTSTVTAVVVGSCVLPRDTAGRLVSLVPRQQTDELSARELEVLAALAGGATNVEIASSLYVSRETVKTHVARVMRKLGVNDRRAAVARGRALGLIDATPTGSVAPPGPEPLVADDPART